MSDVSKARYTDNHDVSLKPLFDRMLRRQRAICFAQEIAGMYIPGSVLEIKLRKSDNSVYFVTLSRVGRLA